MNNTWQWKPGPPGPQTVQAGTRFDFRLPLEGFGSPPACQWSIHFAGLINQAPDDDPLRLVLDIPPHEHGFKKIHYKVHTDPPLTGVLHVRVLPQEQPKEPETPGPQPEPNQAPNENWAKPEDGAPPKIEPPVAPEPEQQTPAQGSHQFTPPPEPLSPGIYQVQVYQGQRRKTQVRLDPQKSIVVGRQSVSKGIIPDVDVAKLVTDRQELQTISREQLKVYWQKGRIVLRNTGKNAVSADNGQIPSQAKQFWQPGERVYLPGGLYFILSREE